jgi:hypothetical protein
MYRFLTLAALICLLARPCLASADLWDDSRYMRVSEVKPGMVGYGLSVFTGSKIEKFDVRVIDVVRNLVNPKCDVILIMPSSPGLEHRGPVEGMSGSPIYLYDLDDKEHTHARMVGAYAYGYEWATEPLAGVQPIEYMLSLPTTNAAVSPARPAVTGEISRPRWSLEDIPALPGMRRNGAGLAARSLASNPWAAGDEVRLRPLATPLMCSGLPPSVARRMGPMFAQCGLDLLEGGGAASKPPAGIRMEPGSVLVAPLLIGDVEMSAGGTCTEVRGDRVFGFGHEFNSEGPIRLPLGTGTCATVVADLHSSFKLIALDRVVGALTADQTVGVGGRLDQTAPMIPIRLRVRYADGSLDQTYQFSAALHPKFTPLVAAAAALAATSAVHELPQFHTLDYDLKLDFADGKSVHLLNKDVNDEAAALAQQIALPIMAASDNAFQRVPLAAMSGTITVSSEVRLAEITSIDLPKLKYAPGDEVKAYVTYRPWREGEQTMPITFPLPKDLPDGQYQMVVSDWQKYFTDQRAAEPFHFTAQSIDDLFAVLTDFEAIRHDALYVRLVRQADGVAVGRWAMPRLPVSVRQELLAAGQSDVTAFITSSVAVAPTDWVMSGSADFALTIDRQTHVESSRSPKPATQP